MVRASRLRLSLVVPLGLLACSTGQTDEGGFTTFSTTNMTSVGDGDGDMMDETGDADTIGPECGDGIVEGDEQCDLGPNNSATGECTSECTIAECGDGLVYEGVEECDDGNQSNDDECVSGCKLATCGDGHVQTGVEECDDGNDDETDGCSSMCLLGSCGDGIIQSDEQCDDGNRDTTDGCPNCQLAYCGDGFVEAGIEECDDGNTADDDGCIPVVCKLATCGDGYVHAGVEQCDDGNLDDTDACPSTCEAATCGDGFVWAGMEACDDGNNVAGDGCSATCQTEAPPVCTQGVDPWTNAPWVVCSSSPQSAWISSNSQGQYHPLAICQQLGYDTISGWGGNYGTVCGYNNPGSSCNNPGNMQFDYVWNGSGNCGQDANGPIICQTVHWNCIKN